MVLKCWTKQIKNIISVQILQDFFCENGETDKKIYKEIFFWNVRPNKSNKGLNFGDKIRRNIF